MKFLSALLLPVAFAITAFAEVVRPVPPPGIEIPAADRAEIEAGVKKLGEEIAKLRELGKTNPLIEKELPNVEIFHKSADWAVRYGEIFDAKQIATAKDHILQGLDRAAALTKGQTPWNTATGLIARGYRSKIDGSVQPYGVLVPESWGQPAEKRASFPLHFWCHGRGEKNTELPFINGVQNSKGEFTPEGAIVCYLFGRYCCANKFAGESDLFEAKADIATHYPIDEQRVVVRGFSMGGAAAWQFAFHFPGSWAAAAPGAGFAETEEFFGRTLYAEGATPPPWWERQLWRWYDVTICARNVAGLSLVAYSGELDGQKQSADIMLRYAAQEKHSFTHIIGPGVPHKYHPDAKPVIEKFIDVALTKGLDPVPKSVSYTTYSLIYPNRAWVHIRGMEKSWERADVDAAIEKDTITVKTKNVSALMLTPGKAAFPPNELPKKVIIDGTTLDTVTVTKGVPVSNYEGCFYLRKEGNKWARTSSVELPSTSITKRPGVCGTVDHAFMSKFLFVRPTGKPLNDALGKWTKSEMEHALKSWRAVFRGDAPIKDDTAVTDVDINNSNLILWGDISSNAVIKRIAEEPIPTNTPDRETATPQSAGKKTAALVPILWGKNELNFKTYRLDPARYAPILIYPNPLNPRRYVVLNSGHTFREFALLNNSDQTPKLPDWAIVDISVPADAKWPGLIFDAGFFDEHWK
ncbi:MAG: alpha/beta hydrolase-fold protein [Chthoniobacteraceae bacterium]